MPRLLLVDDPLFDAHQGPAGHPERPQRLAAARAGVDRIRSRIDVVRTVARDATHEELLRVHSPAFIEQLAATAGSTGYLDADTYFSPQTHAACLRGAGGAIALVDELLAGVAPVGLALVRPPGHHALPSSAMGFCIVGHAALAAAHAKSRGLSRILVVDWDVHHGNGTQSIFHADPTVLYISLHQYPFFPGTGAHDDTGHGEGKGYTVNVPLSGGAGDRVYVEAFQRLVLPITRQFAPELLIVSAGFDAHVRDPLSEMCLGSAIFGWMFAELRAATPPSCAALLVLEGGYDSLAVEESLAATLEAMITPPPLPEAGPYLPSHQVCIEEAWAAQRGFWGLTGGLVMD